MPERQDDLTALRSMRSYRVAIWGLRILVAAFACAVLAVVLWLAGVPPNVIIIPFLAVFLLGPVGIIVGWAGGIPLTRHTTRFTRGGPYGLDLGRATMLLRTLVRDIFRRRKADDVSLGAPGSG